MWYEEHCKECVDKLGSPFSEVHLWLDEFAKTPKYGMKHRRVRHHLAGIAEAEKLFHGGEAARLHVVSDLKMEGWKETDHFPVDEEDYVNMGLF